MISVPRNNQKYLAVLFWGGGYSFITKPLWSSHTVDTSAGTVISIKYSWTQLKVTYFFILIRWSEHTKPLSDHHTHFVHLQVLHMISIPGHTKSTLPTSAGTVISIPRNNQKYLTFLGVGHFSSWNCEKVRPILVLLIFYFCRNHEINHESCWQGLM